ncbi:MAG: hypothetical protein Q8P57_02695 [Candidatus Pacearchaeota archaeon]|nr:hypothetical protein [Candidatus Pacearchaeota archaeon]
MKDTDAMVREREAELREAHRRTYKMFSRHYAELREAEARTDEIALASQFEPKNPYKTFELK